MGQSSSRRSRREALENIEIAKARWNLRFYRWGGTVLLVIITVEAVEAVVALLEGRTPQVVFDVPVR